MRSYRSTSPNVSIDSTKEMRVFLFFHQKTETIIGQATCLKIIHLVHQNPNLCFCMEKPKLSMNLSLLVFLNLLGSVWYLIEWPLNTMFANWNDEQIINSLRPSLIFLSLICCCCYCCSFVIVIITQGLDTHHCYERPTKLTHQVNLDEVYTFSLLVLSGLEVRQVLAVPGSVQCFF